jgi:hypothetical protein
MSEQLHQLILHTRHLAAHDTGPLQVSLAQLRSTLY